MAQLQNLDLRVHGPIDVALPTPLATPGGRTFRRIDRPSYSIVARRYLRVLAGLSHVPAGDRVFFAELRYDLEGALARVEHLLHAGGSPHLRIEAEIELEWRCNQCEHWLGPAATATLEDYADHGQVPAGAVPGATDTELAAVSLLWRAVTLLGRFRRPRWRLPHGYVGFGALVLLRLREAAFFGVRRLMAAFRQFAHRRSQSGKRSPQSPTR